MWIMVLVLFGTIVFYRFVYHQSNWDLFYLFSFLWTGVFLVRLIELFPYYPISSHFIKLIGEGIICWIIGFGAVLLVEKRKGVDTKGYYLKTKANSFEEREISIAVLWFFEIAMLISLSYAAVCAIKYLGEGHSYYELHTFIGGEEYLTQTIPSVWFHVVSFPALLACTPVFSIFLVKDIHRWPTIVGCILLLLFSLVSGKRFLIVYLGLDILLMMAFLEDSLDSKRKNGLLCLFLVLIMLFSLVTALRWKGNIINSISKIVRNICAYMGLGLNVGDHWTKEVDLNHDQSYGYASFAGIINMVDFVTRQFGIRFFNYPQFKEMLNRTQDIRVSIGENMTANAFVTWVYYFYLDFREIGVAIGSAFFGFAAAKIQSWAFEKKTLISIALYLLFAQCVLKSFVRWEFGITVYPIAYIYLAFLFIKRKAKALNEK